MPTRLPIGQLAARSDCKVPTIRYYERIGLLDASPRTEGGHRIYGEDEVKRLVFIRRSRELGFSLEAVRSLLDLSTDRDRSCAEVDAIASEHLDEVLTDRSRSTVIRISAYRACPTQRDRTAETSTTPSTELLRRGVNGAPGNPVARLENALIGRSKQAICGGGERLGLPGDRSNLLP